MVQGPWVMSRVMDRRLPAGAQETFWSDVEREVLALVQKQGPMYPGDVLLGLLRALLNLGLEIKMPLSVGWLRYTV